MATYLADRVIVFSGTPSLATTAHSPQSLLNGMNRFLELLGITFRRDPNNFRPRINKSQSVKVCYSILDITFFLCHLFSRTYFILLLIGFGTEESWAIFLPRRMRYDLIHKLNSSWYKILFRSFCKSLYL